MKITFLEHAKELSQNEQSLLFNEEKSLKDREVLFILFSKRSHNSRPSVSVKNWNKRYSFDFWTKTIDTGYLIGKNSTVVQ